ncbi:hypothetical protein, conserved [Leishmania tarentolae]|uniref:Uncharacterized protein n=1 Tax=Leishmania tarentolae TaxID=5689 RepID=A0A640KRA5_LEITA|nr:hypothetical protein, conserved [Leishmania tarentolae]
MSTVQLHPHFVAAGNYADIRAVVGRLRDPIDSGGFKTNDDAPYLSSAYTSTIHLGEALSKLSYSTSTPSSRYRISNVTASAKTVHPPFAKDAPEAPKRSPPLIEANAGPGDKNTTPFLIPSPQMSPTPTNSGLQLCHCPPLRGAETRQPKVLCIWDVDDTLVASGVSGVRQNTVFRDSELVELFRSAGNTARHLLLSQGSIDDVLEKPGGRLWFLRPFLERTTGFAGDGRARTGDTSGFSSVPALSHGGMKKGKSFFANFLRCGGGIQTKVQPASASSVTRHRDVLNGNRGTNDSPSKHDLRHFAPGTVVVRLANVRERSETVEDSAFLEDPTALPTCTRTFNGDLNDKAEQHGRWLILRPEVWGITLASINTFFPPSRNTAFVNGKVYRKTDVVWSLAMTGEWDSVFFIDNNLSEVGVVRYGLQMSDMLELWCQRKVHRFFQADYLLLATSAKLRDLGLQYGRDITRPPDTAEMAQSLEDERNRSSRGQQAQKAATVSATSSSSFATASKSNNAEEVSESTRCKSAPLSSSGSADSTGSRTRSMTSSDTGRYACWKGCSSMRGSGINSVADDVKIVNSNEKDNTPPHSDVASPLMARRQHGSIHSYRSVDAECLPPTLPSFSCHRLHGTDNGDSGASVTTGSSMMYFPKATYKDVNLVVVNLHMPSEAYRRVLTTARTNSSGQCSVQRADSHLNRYVGQPVFVGDRSCTDEQYTNILKYFQETESTLFQLIEEEMRVNGFVDVSEGSRWVPDTRMVCAPIRTRPTFVPHMLNFYKPFFEELGERLVAVLQRTGGSNASCVLHTEAQRQYCILQRVLPFIDPYLMGDLGRVLFDMYTTEGDVSRSLAEQLKKTIGRTRDRIQPKQERGRQQ